MELDNITDKDRRTAARRCYIGSLPVQGEWRTGTLLVPGVQVVVRLDYMDHGSLSVGTLVFGYINIVYVNS